MNMALYSKEEADYLIEYYSPIMIGGLLEQSTRSKIKDLYKERVGDKYEVRAQGTAIGTFSPYRRIEFVAKSQNLPSPEEVLRQKK